MKVLHVAPRLSGGGAEPVCRLIAEHQASMLDVYVATWLPEPTQLGTATTDPNFTQVTLTRIGRGLRGAISLIFSLREFIKASEPSFIISHLTYTNACVVAAVVSAGGSPSVALVEHNAPVGWPWALKIVMRSLYRRFGLVAVSEDVARSWVELGVPKLKVHMLPNPIELPVGAAAVRLAHLAPSKLVAVGRLASQKNYEFLLETIACLPANVTLDIYGTGDRDYVEKLIRKIDGIGLNERVRLVGAVPRSNLLTAMSSYDAFVITSDFEGEPTVVLEAAALGLPVFGRDTPGLGQTLRKVGGRLISAASLPLDLARELQNHDFTTARPSLDWRQIHEPEVAAHRYCELLGVVHPGRATP